MALTPLTPLTDPTLPTAQVPLTPLAMPAPAIAGGLPPLGGLPKLSDSGQAAGPFPGSSGAGRAAGNGTPQLGSIVSTPSTNANRIGQIQQAIDKIQNPAKPQGFWQNLRHGLAVAGNAAGMVFAPGVEAAIPGSFLNNQMKLGQLNSEQQMLEQQDAQQQDALFKQQQLTLGQKKEDDKTQHDNGTLEASLRAHGFKLGPDGEPVPLAYEEMSPQQQATHDLKDSQANLADATVGLRQAQADLDNARQRGLDPNSPEFKMKQQRVNQEAARTKLMEQNYQMRAFGKDANGNPLPGALLLDDGTPVGTANAPNVRPTATQRDAAGRGTVVDALKTSITQQLNDPDVAQYIGPISGWLAEGKIAVGTAPQKVADFYANMKSYGAFLAGFHPVKGVKAIDYFDKVMGGLHQTPEQLLGKLESNAATSQVVQAVGTPNVSGGKSQQAAGGKTPPPTNGGGAGPKHSLKKAMALPFEAGKSEAQVRADLEAHGYQVIP